MAAAMRGSRNRDRATWQEVRDCGGGRHARESAAQEENFENTRELLEG